MRSQPKPLVVIVEDEEELAKLVAQHLEDAGMQTQVYNRCAPAGRFLRKNFANLVLLDVNLPDQTGFGLLDELRKEGVTTPAIFVTGNSLEVNKVKGLELGGDDYITKPFGYNELVARIRAVLRRAETRDDRKLTVNTSVTDLPFELLGVEVVPARLEAKFPDGQIEKIGRKELGILAFLNEHPNEVIPRKELIHSVWGLHADVKSRSLDQYIVRVRDLYKKHGLDLGCFKTVHGVGYIFEPTS